MPPPRINPPQIDAWIDFSLISSEGGEPPNAGTCPKTVLCRLERGAHVFGDGVLDVFKDAQCAVRHESTLEGEGASFEKINNNPVHSRKIVERGL